MNDVVGVEPAFLVTEFVRELALINMGEESFVGQDMGGIKRTADGLLSYLSHIF